MRSVAIVGFSQKTMHYCLQSKADEVWSLNHIYLIENFPKLTRLFELHKKHWYLRKEVPRSVAYWEWLQKPQEFPIYMQEKTDEVPSSVKYPLDEVIEDCLTGLVEIDDDRNETMRKYFTSSFAYMMALAIHEKFDQIELYGVDMENDTEYGYQRPCGEFWIGIALGRGIKVVIPKPCEMCNAVLYGYDIVPYIDVNRLKEIIKIYQMKYDHLYKQMKEIGKKVGDDPTNEETIKDYMEVSMWTYMHEGAIAAGAKLINESDSYISRMWIEMKNENNINGLNYWTAMTNKTKAEYEINPSDKGWMDYLTARANMFNNLGGFQLHKQLIKTVDMRKVDYVMVKEIVEMDDDKDADRKLQPYKPVVYKPREEVADGAV